VLVLGDRYFLRYYTTITEVGIYSIGYRIASALSLVVGAFQTAWPALMFSAARTAEGPRFISRVLTYIVFVQLYLALGLSVLIDDILVLLTSEAYYTASQIVPLITLSYVFYGAYYVTSSGISIKNKTIYASLVVVSAAIIQTAINFYLIPKYGMMGAAISTVFSYLLLPISSALISNKMYPVQYEIHRLISILFIAVGIFFLSKFIQVDNVYISFFLKGLFAASFPIWIWLFRLVQPDEQHAIKSQFVKVYRYIHKLT
jgi:O-antigen/teichoic acid export membrane protein